MIGPDDTITAISTPIGEGGIGVLRISGKNAIPLAEKMFRLSSVVPVSGFPTHTAHYGFAYDPITQEDIDDGILTIFRAPHSYTGEDSVEISCHGGIVPMRRVLDAALLAGARLAEPGEFTKRAFLNGKLDLVQAEAVLDIIRAQTDEAMRVARQQFDGFLSSSIRVLRQEMIDILAGIEAAIDFPDDVEEVRPERIADALGKILERIVELLSTADRGKIYRDGIRTVIVGKPNAGKSSLLNALVRESRAIVTPIPGTTRDTIEEGINIRGIPVRAIDTAGIRETDDPIEKEGVERTQRTIDEADIVLAVIDSCDGFAASDRELITDLAGKKQIIVLSKCDLFRTSDCAKLAKKIKKWADGELTEEIRIIATAAPSNEGIAELEDAIVEMVLAGECRASDGVVVSNIRHKRALDECRSSIEQSLSTIRSGLPIDFLSGDLKSAADSLGSITGETVTDNVIDRIFSDFCIGK